MFLGRIKYKNKIYFGIVEGDYLISNRKKIKLKKVKVLTPTIPTKIICLGLNYKSHAIELNMKIPSTPVIFLKPPSSIIAHKEKIIYPKMSKLLHYEGEVAVVVKKTCKDVKSIEAKKYILGI
ncbi:MAG: fumarylacetoacetate hydrolase family protein, partial [bacterium]|nr:fumarylacetoacetate hydrolase family protein [bacterium]